MRSWQNAHSSVVCVIGARSRCTWQWRTKLLSECLSREGISTPGKGPRGRPVSNDSWLAKPREREREREIGRTSMTASWTGPHFHSAPITLTIFLQSSKLLGRTTTGDLDTLSGMARSPAVACVCVCVARAFACACVTREKGNIIGPFKNVIRLLQTSN